MVRHWRQEEFYPFTPMIQLCSPHCPGCRAVPGPLPVGVVTGQGRVLHFQAEQIHALPDEVAQDVIAHELAHVLQYAEGDFDNMSKFEAELGADEMIEWWGFDSESLDRWALDTGRTKLIEVTPEEFFERLFTHGR